MKITQRFFGLLALLALGCGPKYDYWRVSKFKMTPGALADNEEIKLVYTSQGPDNNKALEYYVHVVVVSQKTGDTVNVLTTANNGFKEDEGDKVYNYFSQDNPATKLIQLEMDEEEASKPIDLNQLQLKKITKVARDPKFDYIADNQFPTVIGAIGILDTSSTR